MLARIRLIFWAAFMALALNGAALAGPVEDANAAYERGDFAAALRLLKPLADQGDAAAQFNLGILYDRGQGVAPDFVEAARWYRLSADQGFEIAQASLAFLYANGKGVPQSFSSAYLWFSLAAAQGNQNAAINRDRAAMLMSPAEVAEADRQLRAWKPVAPRPKEKAI